MPFGTDALPGTIDLGLAAGMWSDDAITLNLTADDTWGTDKNIRVVFAANGGANGSGGGNLEAAFDNVSVSAVPEPSAALLGGLGVLALLRRRR